MQIFNSHDPPGGCTPVNARRTSLPSKTIMDEVFRFAGVGLAAKLELSLDYTLPELTRLVLLTS